MIESQNGTENSRRKIDVMEKLFVLATTDFNIVLMATQQ